MNLIKPLIFIAAVFAVNAGFAAPVKFEISNNSGKSVTVYSRANGFTDNLGIDKKDHMIKKPISLPLAEEDFTAYYFDRAAPLPPPYVHTMVSIDSNYELVSKCDSKVKGDPNCLCIVLDKPADKDGNYVINIYSMEEKKCKTT